MIWEKCVSNFYLLFLGAWRGVKPPAEGVGRDIVRPQGETSPFLCVQRAQVQAARNLGGHTIGRLFNGLYCYP
jgi:hypothetical protein